MINKILAVELLIQEARRALDEGDFEVAYGRARVAYTERMKRADTALQKLMEARRAAAEYAGRGDFSAASQRLLEALAEKKGRRT